MADAETLESLGPPGRHHGAAARPGRLSVGSRADAREPAPLPGRGGLRGARRHRRAATSPRCATSWATCCCRSLFHSEIAAEGGHFRLADVARAIADKLVRRHPHVFADVAVRDADEVVRNWRRIKAEERRAAGGGAEPAGVLATVPDRPARPRPRAAGRREARARGFDWPDLAGVLAKLDEERDELGEALRSGDHAAAARELGDLLLTLDQRGAAPRRAGGDGAARRDRSPGAARRPRRGGGARRPAAPLASPRRAERDRLWEAAKARPTRRRRLGAPAPDADGLTRIYGRAAW